MHRLENLALLRWLKKTSPSYFAKSCELAEQMEGWLSYVPATYPHYTRHTLAHSIAIVSQISKLLFSGQHSKSPVIADLSPTEGYLLVAGAMLHDAGMVVSASEQAKLLATASWAEYKNCFALPARLVNTSDVSPQNAVPDDAEQFLRGIELRHQVAEYYRRIHHLRSAEIARKYEPELGRFAFANPQLREAVASVCAGHGLSIAELDDPIRFPDSCDLRGDKVNLRFVAMLLRLGDLLDMEAERACPLLMSAAAPLPQESQAHWTQYHRIVLKDVVPEKITIHARCRTADEDRVLRDWCQWITNEVSAVHLRVGNWSRHSRWRPPTAIMGGPAATIEISPAPGSTYRPVEWRLEVDHDVLFDLLSQKLYGATQPFVRELLQNALDAVRCRIHAALPRSDEPIHDAICVLDRASVAPYALEVQHREDDGRTVITVRDRGIGMTEDTIQRFFLQVGRSYYSTNEFRVAYSFNPTSHFGIGFLSVFAVSDHVEVRTRAVGAAKGIRMRLTRPRSYILVEEDLEQPVGTEISVFLREPWSAEMFEEHVKGLCRNVEIPIDVIAAGKTTRVEAHAAEAEGPSSNPRYDGGFELVSRRIRSPSLRGALCHIIRQHDGVADWSITNYQVRRYKEDNPRAAVPSMPPSYLCVHGLSLRQAPPHEHLGSYAEQLDWRGSAAVVGASRSSSNWTPDTQSEWRDWLQEHLSARDADYVYLNRLAHKFVNVGEDFWLSVLGMVRTWSGDVPRLLSMRDLGQQPSLFFCDESYVFAAEKSVNATYRMMVRRSRSENAWSPFRDPASDCLNLLHAEDAARLASVIEERVRSEFAFRTARVITQELRGAALFELVETSPTPLEKKLGSRRRGYAVRPIHAGGAFGTPMVRLSFHGPFSGCVAIDLDSEFGSWISRVAERSIALDDADQSEVMFSDAAISGIVAHLCDRERRSNTRSLLARYQGGDVPRECHAPDLSDREIGCIEVM